MGSHSWLTLAQATSTYVENPLQAACALQSDARSMVDHNVKSTYGFGLCQKAGLRTPMEREYGPNEHGWVWVSALHLSHYLCRLFLCGAGRLGAVSSFVGNRGRPGAAAHGQALRFPTLPPNEEQLHRGGWAAACAACERNAARAARPARRLGRGGVSVFPPPFRWRPPRCSIAGWSCGRFLDLL